MWRERVWSAWPAIVVEDGAEQLVTYIPPGTVVRHAAAGDGTPLRLYRDEWTFADRVTTRPVLSFAPVDREHATLVFWDTRWRFDGWYVNLERRLARGDRTYDFVDHCLDVLIPPDRTAWTWKDEDELAEAVALGIFSPAQARAFRREGELAARDVLERRPPFDRDWSAWRPDAEWRVPTLVGGWDVVGVAARDGLTLLREHVERFNDAIRTRDWTQMLELFDADATLRFEGVPVGPFEGREAIAQAYRSQPPDDRVRIIDADASEPDLVVARYAWLAEPGRAAGEMRVRHRDGRITELVVTFDQA